MKFIDLKRLGRAMLVLGTVIFLIWAFGVGLLFLMARIAGVACFAAFVLGGGLWLVYQALGPEKKESPDSTDSP